MFTDPKADAPPADPNADPDAPPKADGRELDALPKADVLPKAEPEDDGEPKADGVANEVCPKPDPRAAPPWGCSNLQLLPYAHRFCRKNLQTVMLLVRKDAK